MKNAKATVVCIGRFHHFDLAREMLKRGMLQCIITGYPRWKLADEGIPRELISSFPWLQTPYMALRRWGILREGRVENELAWLAHESLDHHVANNLPGSEVLIALSGSGLRCGEATQRRGGKWVCDRGSSHIRTQQRILHEEFMRWNEHFPGIDSRFIDKEEAEYEKADIVTVPSAFAYRSFIEMGVPATKMRKIPYGVDLRRFGKVADPTPNYFDVVFVGQICFRKGAPDVLEAFRRLRHPRKRLRFIGTIRPEMDRYLRRSPPPQNVEFLGHIPQSQLKDTLSRSHVMVLPSLEEGLALVQAQALACGCPLIATENTGAEDLFTHGKEGFIIPVRDPAAIKDKLQLLADDPGSRTAMSEAAVSKVSELGGWQTYGERFATLLKDLDERVDLDSPRESVCVQV